MDFTYDSSKPSIIETWLYKSKSGLIERWQKRMFKLQGRAVFYFKKESGVCGFIPLIDVDVSDVPTKKTKMFGFMILCRSKLYNSKQYEYIMCAENRETRDRWKKAILENRAYSIVGKPLINACSVLPTYFVQFEVNTLLPYFVPPIFQALNEYGYKLHGIWTVDVSVESLKSLMFTLDQNYFLPTEDLHYTCGAFVYYLKQLPDSLIPCEFLYQINEKVTVEEITEKIQSLPAPSRQLLKVIATHLNKIILNKDINNNTQYSLVPIFGPVILRDPSTHTKTSKKLHPNIVKAIQENFIKLFITEADKIFEDIHQLKKAFSMPIIKRARILNTIATKDNDDELHGTRGLMVNVVSTDENGWCVVYTMNKRAGLVHETNLKELTPEEEKEIKSGPNIDDLLDVVREKNPDMMLIFDSIIEEMSQINIALEAL
ncbi:Variant SH3 domain containing protein [Tritrichomonas foetus]|uniref:Variant SH3 domain containing protein n=1 Tax=Tritrichomonas foetus TaxID=1144522 RepID=A0A1J4JHP8_9EUKA|nr:Variant SH3 domain containing protein [Tritrichomonas foetus]|eukprot:OHS98682.1 Variant SH3 domain containing protein [Tritrichomonas foetus]